MSVVVDLSVAAVFGLSTGLGIAFGSYWWSRDARISRRRRRDARRWSR